MLGEVASSASIAAEDFIAFAEIVLRTTLDSLLAARILSFALFQARFASNSLRATAETCDIFINLMVFIFTIARFFIRFSFSSSVIVPLMASWLCGSSS